MPRPTQSKVKQAIFNIFQEEIPGSEFLDLFAGKGTIGLEALNKGAGKTVFVENNPLCFRNLVQQIRKLKIEDRTGIIKQDVLSAIERLSQNDRKFDFIFADPPYHENLYEKILTGLVKYDTLKKSGFLILEHYWKEALPEENDVFRLWKKKKYGDTVLSIYKKVDRI